MYLAENSVFITIATLLEVFLFTPTDEPVKVEYEGFIRCRLVLA